MRLLFVLVMGLAWPSLSAAQPEWTRYPAAREVQFRNIAARVRVTPENRTDIAISIANSGPLPEARIRVSGRRLVIEGGLRGQIESCEIGAEEAFSVETSRQGRVEGDELPTILVRTPQAAVLSASGAFAFDLGPAQSARLAFEGCGSADVERVEDALDVSIAGTPHLRVYEAGAVSLSMAGEGEARLGAVREALTASLAGDGDLDVRRADGAVSIAVQGNGDAHIHDGRAATLSAAIFGDGNITYGGVATTVDAAIFGDGDVRVGRAEGRVSRRIFGSGTVQIGQ